MANIITTQLSNNDSIELFIRHWKYGHNYEDSTVLVDPFYNIIAFHDRGTPNIDTIQTEIPFEGGFIVANGEGIDVKEHIKYKPYNYEMAEKIYHNNINRLKQKGETEKLSLFYKKIREEISTYNVEYFDNLLNNI